MLPEKYALVANGHWHAAGYPDAFRALGGLACYAKKVGTSEDRFVHLSARAAAQVRGRGRNAAREEHLSRRAYASARTTHRGSRENHADTDALCAWLATREQLTFSGRSGASQRKVLDALTRRAKAARTIHGLNASVRLLSEETLLATATVQRALESLIARGVVRRSYQRRGMASTVDLIAADVPAIDAYLAFHDALTPGDLAEEAWARAGLRGHHQAVFALVAGGAAVTAPEITRMVNISAGTARRTLTDLVSAGLLSRERVGRGWVYALGEVSVDDAAENRELRGVPTVGKRERMRFEYARQREAFAEVLAAEARGERVRKVGSAGRRRRQRVSVQPPETCEGYWEALFASKPASDPIGEDFDRSVPVAVMDTPGSVEVVTATGFTVAEMMDALMTGRSLMPVVEQVRCEPSRPVVTPDAIRTEPLDVLLRDYEPVVWTPGVTQQALIREFSARFGLSLDDEPTLDAAIALGVVPPRAMAAA